MKVALNFAAATDYELHQTNFTITSQSIKKAPVKTVIL